MPCRCSSSIVWSHEWWVASVPGAKSCCRYVEACFFYLSTSDFAFSPLWPVLPTNTAIAKLRLYKKPYIRFRYPRAPVALCSALVDADALWLWRLYYQRSYQVRIDLSVKSAQTSPIVVLSYFWGTFPLAWERKSSFLSCPMGSGSLRRSFILRSVGPGTEAAGGSASRTNPWGN